MGEVWLADDTRLNRKVAIKVLPAEFTQDAERVRRFKQEAQAASALNHPNIITLYDIGETETERFIVMELVTGRTLREVIGGESSIDAVLAVGMQMANALTAAHVAGITHRDIKPDNIMLRDDGYVKMLDFGLARLLPSMTGDADAATIAHQTAPGMIVGTVAYMSPEQASGQSVGPPSDVFSLGVVLYELATGRHPFQSDTIVGYLHAITIKPPPELSGLKSWVNRALDDVILRMLDKEPSKRPTATDVSAEFMEIERFGTLKTSPISLAQHAAAYAATIAKSSEGTRHQPSLVRHSVGRELERDELLAAFTATAMGRGLLFCIAGEPGIGKTTLVEDFLSDITAKGRCTIGRGRCSERLAGTEAYLPLLEALESLVNHDIDSTAVRAIKQVAPTWYAQLVPPSADSDVLLLVDAKGTSQERMKRELGNLLQELARLRPLVLFFDDLHWADVSTIDVLSFLSGKLDALSLLIVVTYRPSDMLLTKHPFLKIKPDLQARGVCRELLLDFLQQSEIAEYLELQFPAHRFPAEFPKMIYEKTEGSPLFMADLVRYLRDRGVISETSGTWTLANTLPDIESKLPESVRGMIERKIAQLSDEDRKLLTVASVQGYEFDAAVVAQVLNIDSDVVEERLEELERVFAFVKLVSESEFPNRSLTLKYRFVHVLYQNTLYASLRATRKATLSREVAQTLESLYGEKTSSVANELALLWEAARDYGRAADYFLVAAQQASQAFAHHEAETLSRHGLEVLKHLPEDSERVRRELDLQLTLGPAVMITKGWAAPELETIYSKAQENCRKLGDSVQLFPTLNGLWNFYLLHGDYRLARNVGKDLLSLSQTAQDPALALVAHWALVESSFWPGDFEFTQSQIQQVVSLYDFERDRPLALVYGQDPWVICRAYDSLIHLLLGYPQQALKATDETYARATDLGQPFDVCNALQFAAMVHLIRREPLQVHEKAKAMAALSDEHGFAMLRALADIFQGNALAQQGVVEEGIGELQRGLIAYRVTGAEAYGTFFGALMAEAQEKAGTVDEGLKTIDQAIRFAEIKDERFYEPELHRLRGELLLAGGAGRSEVDECYQRAIDIARRQQSRLLELRAVTSLAQLWQKQGKLSEVRQALSEIYGWFTEGFDTKDLQDAKALLNDLQ